MCIRDSDSFDYIARIMVANCAVVVNKDAPWNNLKEFEAAAKKEPGKLVLDVYKRQHRDRPLH